MKVNSGLIMPDFPIYGMAPGSFALTQPAFLKLGRCVLYRSNPVSINPDPLVNGAGTKRIDLRLPAYGMINPGDVGALTGQTPYAAPAPGQRPGRCSGNG